MISNWINQIFLENDELNKTFIAVLKIEYMIFL